MSAGYNVENVNVLYLVTLLWFSKIYHVYDENLVSKFEIGLFWQLKPKEFWKLNVDHIT